MEDGHFDDAFDCITSIRYKCYRFEDRILQKIPIDFVNYHLVVLTSELISKNSAAYGVSVDFQQET